MGAFYWTKSRLNFRKFHVPNGTVLWLRLHRPDPSHRAFSYCSCKKYTKVRYWGDLRRTIWSNGKGHFVPTHQNDQTGQSGPCTFKFRSDQTELVHSNGCTTLRPRTLFRHCFADGLNQKFISVCGSSCRVVRCQVLRIQWNFKSLERKKVFVISKSFVLKGCSQEETDKASS